MFLLVFLLFVSFSILETCTLVKEAHGEGHRGEIKLLCSGQETCSLSTILYCQYVVVSSGKIQHLLKKDRKEAVTFQSVSDSSVVFTSATNQPVFFFVLLLLLCFLQDTALDPGEDVALLSVSFEDAEATQVFPKLYLSPSIEQYVLYIFTYFHLLCLRNENDLVLKLFVGKY